MTLQTVPEVVIMAFPLFLLSIRLLASEAQRYQPLFADFLPIESEESPKPQHRPHFRQYRYPYHVYHGYHGYPQERQFSVVQRQEEEERVKVD